MTANPPDPAQGLKPIPPQRPPGVSPTPPPAPPSSPARQPEAAQPVVPPSVERTTVTSSPPSAPVAVPANPITKPVAANSISVPTQPVANTINLPTIPPTPSASPPAPPSAAHPTTSSAPSANNTPPVTTTAVPQVRFQSNGNQLELILPPELEQRGHGSPSPGLSLTWMEIWHQLKQRLNGAQRFWAAETDVQLLTHDRLLDGRQLQAIVDALSAVQLRLKRVHTSRRQTAVVAATAGYSVEQQIPPNPSLLANPTTPAAKILADPLYIQMTLRSGAEIRHPGTVVVFGDLNPGSSIIADGDILVWGRLRGVAHAGASGNVRCLITALQMEPTQLRIAHMLARAPSNPPDRFYPEVAYVTNGGICIMGITEFSKKSFPLLAELEDTGVSS